MKRRSEKSFLAPAQSTAYIGWIRTLLLLSVVLLTWGSAKAEIKIRGKVWTIERTTPSMATVRVLKGKGLKACQTCEVTTQTGDYEMVVALAPGRYTLKAYDTEGKWLDDSKVRVLSEGSNEDVDFTLRRPIASADWRGTIRDAAGQGLASVQVILSLGDCEGCVVRRTKTDAKGEYEALELAAFRIYQLVVEFDGRSSSPEEFYVGSAVAYRADLRIDRQGSELVVSAQPFRLRMQRPSQKASILQTIGVTDVTITYSRPAVRGRTIWGDALPQQNARGEATLDNQNDRPKNAPIVPWGHVWRAGANEATTFTVTDDVLINGQKLPAGSYSLHAIPTKDEWTIVFNDTANQWGSFNYDPAKDTLRVKAKPQWVAENQEWLEYTVPVVTPNSAQVVIRWEKVAVPFTIEVPNVEALWRAQVEAAIAANPSNEALPLQVAATYAGAGNWDEALKWVDQSIKVRETFRNLSAKANYLWAAGRKEQALKIARLAIDKGKAEKVDTTTFEKRVTTMMGEKN